MKIEEFTKVFVPEDAMVSSWFNRWLPPLRLIHTACQRRISQDETLWSQQPLNVLVPGFDRALESEWKAPPLNRYSSYSQRGS